MSRKVFTAGEVLAAADVNSFLMDQTVMSFAGTAARGSAIPTPVEGMYTHLEDTDRLQFWNGSAWVEQAGMTLLNTTSFTSQSTINFDNVFSSSFDNYKIVYNITSATTAGADVLLRMRAGGTTNSSSQYQQGNLFIGVAANLNFGSSNNATSTGFTIGNANDTRGGSGEATLYRPFLSESTNVNSTGFGNIVYHTTGITTVTTSYDGFTINISLGTASGTIRVYGLRNA
jgi:hypothetical protein